MKISGFTFARNASKFYYPVKEAIQSILPIVDEFIVALGDCDDDDETEKEILSIGSDKIKIIHTTWDLVKYPTGMEYAHQTDIAKEACSGDWLFYIQGDEIVHEKYLPGIVEECKKYLNSPEVEGFVFNYKHFWGDYDHFVLSHAWYPHEVRIIRNDKDIHSWRDAQSFRRIEDFDQLDYFQKIGTSKLNVVPLDAYIYHYGFVRPPQLMQRKHKNHHTIYNGRESAELKYQNANTLYDYGNLNKIELFKETHPEVMNRFIKKFYWKDQLRFVSKSGQNPQKHEKIKYRLVTFIEQNLLGGNQLFGFHNYKVIKKYKKTEFTYNLSSLEKDM